MRGFVQMTQMALAASSEGGLDLPNPINICLIRLLVSCV